MSTKIQSARAAAARARSKVQDMEHGLVRKSVIGVTGATLAMAGQREVLPVEVAGVPTKLGLALAATLVEAMSKGPVRRIAGAVGDASLAVYAHEAVQNESFVAGVAGDAGSNEGTEF